ncbi:MAG: hypothetical protein WD847_14950 [Pirellulales bacterium]
MANTTASSQEADLSADATVLSGALHIHVAFDWGDEVDLAQAQQLAPSRLRALTRRPRTPSSIAYRPPAAATIDTGSPGRPDRIDGMDPNPYKSPESEGSPSKGSPSELTWRAILALVVLGYVLTLVGGIFVEHRFDPWYGVVGGISVLLTLVLFRFRHR